jgi:hypothetical protein
MPIGRRPIRLCPPLFFDGAAARMEHVVEESSGEPRHACGVAASAFMRVAGVFSGRIGEGNCEWVGRLRWRQLWRGCWWPG